MGVRQYNSAAGIFTSQDSLGFGGGSNFYKYASNNPFVFIDPFGLCDKCEPPKDAIAGIAVHTALVAAERCSVGVTKFMATHATCVVLGEVMLAADIVKIYYYDINVVKDIWWPEQPGPTPTPGYPGWPGPTPTPTPPIGSGA